MLKVVVLLALASKGLTVNPCYPHSSDARQCRSRSFPTCLQSTFRCMQRG